MRPIVSFSYGTDPVTGEYVVMCPLCFHMNPLISAREGGRLSTNEDGSMSDACIDCASAEYLYGANLMGA